MAVLAVAVAVVKPQDAQIMKWVPGEEPEREEGMGKSSAV